MENKSCCAGKEPALENTSASTSSCCTPGSCKTDGGGCDSKKCCGTGIKGMLLGGLVMFAWLSVSWMLLPWHEATMYSFAEPAIVGKVIDDNAVTSGIYTIPSNGSMEMTKPFAFVSVFKDGASAADMGMQLGKQLLLCLLAAGMLTCLLSKTKQGCPVLASAKVGGIAALMAVLPNWIWFHFDLPYTFVTAADVIISVTLAGLAISKLVLKMPGCCAGKKKEGGGSCCDTKKSDETKGGSCCG